MASPETGDSYLFTCIERNTKLLICWHLGKRTPEATELFAHKMQRAIGSPKFHLSTDGFTPYRKFLPAALAGRINYGQIVKIFGKTTVDDQRKYSPAKISRIKKETILGEPNQAQICTSHVERHNLTLRTFVRRMGRLTCCFSKKWENHEAMIGLAIFHYNSCYNDPMPSKRDKATTPPWQFSLRASLTVMTLTCARVSSRLAQVTDIV